MQSAGPRLTAASSGNELFLSQPPDGLPGELALEWNTVCREQCGLLLEAQPDTAGQFLAALRPHLRAPVHEYRTRVGVPAPRPTEGSVIVLEVAKLGPGEQAALLAWLAECQGRVQVAATSSEPLYPLVERGSFDAALYYRLNIVRIAIYP